MAQWISSSRPKARDAVAVAHERAWQRFEGLLQELVNELPGLRATVNERCALQGVVARRMWAACSPYRAGFITSMAAVAGAVAQWRRRFWPATSSRA